MGTEEANFSILTARCNVLRGLVHACTGPRGKETIQLEDLAIASNKLKGQPNLVWRLDGWQIQRKPPTFLPQFYTLQQ